jgi:hypothetical protein
MDTNFILEKIEKELKPNGHRLLYLCRFGSHLYGTDSEQSDDDFRGIFLPSRNSCLLNTSPKFFDFSSKKNSDRKNFKEDYDIGLWSLQYFLNLVKVGDTNAIDLLYSLSNTEMIIENIWLTPCFRPMTVLYQEHKKLFSRKSTKAFMSYCIGQARKYGIKGSRVGVVKKINEYISCVGSRVGGSYYEEPTFTKLSYIAESLVKSVNEPSYCFIKWVDAKPRSKETLFVNGTQHHLDITLEEFKCRMDTEYKKYGERAKQAENNEGLDFKALSHAVRAIRQVELLLTTGEIKYPLYCASEIKDIKYGRKTWKDIERIINDGIENVNNLQESTIEEKIDPNFIDNFILNCY